jgi:hypothetical protein
VAAPRAASLPSIAPCPRGFKALKQVVKLYYKMGKTDKMIEAYRCGGGGCRICLARNSSRDGGRRRGGALPLWTACYVDTWRWRRRNLVPAQSSRLGACPTPRPPRQMLSYVDCAAVTRNASEKKLNSLLDFIGASSDTDLLQQFYETTLRALEKARNDRWGSCAWRATWVTLGAAA